MRHRLLPCATRHAAHGVHQSIRNDGDRIHLDEVLGASEPAYHDAGRYGKNARQPFAYHAVDVFAVTRVADIDRELADVFEFYAGLFHQHVDIFHRLLGLSGHISDANAFGRIQFLANLAAQENHAAACDDGLAEIIADGLFRVSVLGVESPDALVFHLMRLVR